MTTTHALCPHHMEVVKTSADGRFLLCARYKLGNGERWRFAMSSARYVVIDTVANDATRLETLRHVDSMVHHTLTGEQTAPWFHSAAEAPRTQWVKVPA